MRKSTALKRKKHAIYAKRRNKKVKAVVLTALAGVLLASFFAIKSIVLPTVSAFSSKSSDLKSKDIYSILVVQKTDQDVITSATVLIVQKKDKKLYSVELDPEKKLDLPGRFGEESYKTILKLADSVEKDITGPQLLLETTKELLQLAVDKYLILDASEFENIESGLYKKNLGSILPWQLNRALSESITNMAGGELLDLLLFTRSLEDRDFETVKLEQVADWSLKIRDITLNAQVSEESLGVVILNGTGKPNVGKQTAQILQNMGARISLVDNAENDYEKSYLVTDNPEKATVAYIKSYYPDIAIISKVKASSLGEMLLDRGDICVILGFDILAEAE